MSNLFAQPAEPGRIGAFSRVICCFAARSRTFLRTFGWVLAAASLAAFLLALAFQSHPTYDVAIGDTPHDAALIHNFNLPERQAAADGGRRFRWTRGTSTVIFPGIGRGAVAIDLLLAAGTNPASNIRVFANQTELATLHLTPDFQHYQLIAPASIMGLGTLHLMLVSIPFTPRGDRRVLGTAVGEIMIRPVDHGIVSPPTHVFFSLWLGAIAVALALLVAGLPGAGAFIGVTIITLGMAALLVVNRLFLTADAGGVVRAGLLMFIVATAIRSFLPPLGRRFGLAITTREVRWLAVIASAVLAVRFAGILHPSIVIIDLKFHLHRFAEVADNHQLLLPISTREFGDRTVLYAPTPYLAMLPFSWLLHDRVLLLFLFALGIDALRFCIIWITARQVTRDLLTANLVVLTMALMPVGWIAYEWGIFANLFAEGMLTILFALLVLRYERLAGPRCWQWCIIFAVVICLTLLAHIGVLVLTGATVAFFLLLRVAGLSIPFGTSRRAHASETVRQAWGRAMRFAIAGLSAVIVAFVLFYHLPAHDLLAHRPVPSIGQDATAPRPPLMQHQYHTGGATPDDRIGLSAITTPHLSVALALEAWENAAAFYRVWPVMACIGGVLLLFVASAPRVRQEQPGSEHPTARRGATWARKARGLADTFETRMGATALAIAVWMLVATLMLVVGIVAQLYVRYSLYALPAVAFGSGIALTWLVRRVRWGWLVVTVLLGFSGVTTLLMWYDRIVYALKPIK